jgi:uncharacterized protein (TIGR02284 family)
METDNLIKKLIGLAQLDIDAAGAYDKALEHISEAPIKAQLRKFKADHKRHVKDLSAYIKALGGKPPTNTPDIAGVFLKIFTALRSSTGTEGALKAMRGNEELTNKIYTEALEERGIPREIRSLIVANKKDEALHLKYILSALKVKEVKPK